MQSPDHQTPEQRLVFLLTCWLVQEVGDQHGSWRFKLATPGPGKHRQFMTLDEVIKTIESELSHNE